MTNKNDNFDALSNLEVPEPSQKARERSLETALLAFDKVQDEKKSNSSQGIGWVERLMSILNLSRRSWMMDIRIPVGAAAVGLLLFPLALQLNSTTGLTGLNMPNLARPEPIESPMLEHEPVVEELPLAKGLAGQVQNDVVSDDMRERAVSAPGVLAKREAPAEGISGFVNAAPRPEPMAGAGYEQNGDTFAEFEQSSLFVTADNPVSTFSIDVDTASYAYVRRMLEQGQLPQPNAVRAEEMVNYFNYDYAGPSNPDVPFTQTVGVYPTPWNEDTKLLHIGIKGYTPPIDEAKPTNLVFLIDTSGSMNAADKLPLLKNSFALLLDQMDENDTISIVTYAGSAGVVLEPTPASERGKIIDALTNLTPGGSTAGAAGIEQAYRLAEEAKSADSVNRVILATDGDFNVGISEPAQLKSFIEKRRDEGISLSVLGFGLGNYNDALMQALAQNGNGNAFYIDSYREARKVLVEQVQGTLTTIAKDVKIQVEFNPTIVSEYRLVGYETRALKREDFNNDKVDAGDIGAGHTVTAIYEITPVGSDAQVVDPLRYDTETAKPTELNANEYAFLKLRYKLPGQTQSQLIEQPVLVSSAHKDIGEVSGDMRFAAAVAAFGQKLRGGNYADEMSFDDIKALADGARGQDEHGYRGEFSSLVELADSLSRANSR